ncbi:MAG: DUF1080 domain-containing protein [Opitutaceae bacterium]
MKKLLFSGLATLALLLPSAHAAAEADRGFVPLFNGKNLDGWNLKIRSGDAELAKKVFTVEDGMIHGFGGLPDRYELDTGSNATHGMIYTTKKYRRFIFRFEYKWGTKIANNFAQFQYDAGCYFHVSNDKIWPTGIEFQIRYDSVNRVNHTGDFWSPPDTKIQWYSADGRTFALPRDGGKPQPIKKAEHLGLANAPYHGLDGQWNKCEVIVMGGAYAIQKLNGVIINLATDITPSEGLIGLQAETAEIFYRNLEIKELTEDLPMEAFLK